MPNLLQNATVYNISCRLITSKGFKWAGEGIRYPGFTYHPRTPDFQDPPYEPSKLFRVQRIRPLKGVPKREKTILRQLKLDGERTSEVVILKNIPEINGLLWKVKHLVQIKPITFPNGFPDSPDGTYLKENGELVVMKEIRPVEQKMLVTEEFRSDPKKMDTITLRKELRKKWLNGWSLLM